MYISCLITLDAPTFWARKFQTFQNEGKDQEWMKGLEIALIILNSHRHGRKKILEKIWGSFDRHEIELQSLLIQKETTQSFRASFTEFLWREDVWQNFPLSPQQQQSFSFKTKEVKKELSLFLLFFLLWSMEKSEKWLRKIREIREKSFLNNLQMNFEWDFLSDFSNTMHSNSTFLHQKFEKNEYSKKPKNLMSYHHFFKARIRCIFHEHNHHCDQPIAHFKIEVNLKADHNKYDQKWSSIFFTLFLNQRSLRV